MASGTGRGGTSRGIAAHSADAVITAKSFDKPHWQTSCELAEAARREGDKSQSSQRTFRYFCISSTSTRPMIQLFQVDATIEL